MHFQQGFWVDKRRSDPRRDVISEGTSTTKPMLLPRVLASQSIKMINDCVLSALKWVVLSCSCP